MEANLLYEGSQFRGIAAAALNAGEVIQLPDGRAGIVEGLKNVAAGDMYAAVTVGIAEIAKASGTTFTAGAPVYWDASANLAIGAPGAGDDIYLGSCVKAAISGEVVVQVALNVITAGPSEYLARGVFATRIVLIDHADAAEHDVLEAAENPNGMYVAGFFGEVTEQAAGTEDQLGITLYDGNDAAQSVILFTDAGADAVGDIVKGTRTLIDGAQNDVIAKIPAGKRAYIKVSQPTTGAAAGAANCWALLQPV